MSAGTKEPLLLFYCYSHKDKSFRDELDNHLSNLKYQGIIDSRSDREISPGTDWEKEINNYLNTAHIILLLTSADFIASNYCYGIEMKRAFARHKARTARVIPIILRSHDWQNAPYSFLQVLPTNAQPITKWENRDEAFLDIIQGIRKSIKELQTILKNAEEDIKEYDVKNENNQQEIEVLMKESLQEKREKYRLDYFLFPMTAFLNTWLSFPRDEDSTVTESAYIDQTRITATETINQLNRILAIKQAKNLLDKNIAEEVLNIIKKLRLLEVKRLYLDGGKSWKEFCHLADDISLDMRNLIDQIRKRMLSE